MNESHKSARLSNDLAFVSKPERSYWSLTPQLDTVVIEVSSLRLRGNLRRLYGAKQFPSQNWTYGDTGFYSGQSYIAKEENMNMQFS